MNKYKDREPRAMAEIHKIREKIFKNVRNFNSQELIKYFNDGAVKFIKKMGLKVSLTSKGTIIAR